MRALIVTLALAALTSAQPAAPPLNPKALKFPPLRDIPTPKVETFTLANGMRVYLLENHELPLISGRALVRTGSLFDPVDKSGLADLTGDLIRRGGTRAMTQEQVNEALEDIAGSVESSIGEQSGSVSFSALKETSGQVLAIFKEVLTRPAFAQDKFELAKTQYRSAISRRNDDAGEVANREFEKVLNDPNTPWGRQTEYATIDAITRQDVVAFHDRYFFPANVMLSIQGDFETAAMKAELEKLFADWTVKRDPIAPFPPFTAKPKPGLFLAEKSDVTQTFFQIGHLGGKLSDKDYPALEVMASILGGGFPSRLVRKIRSEMGAAYAIYANWGAGMNSPGIFRIGGSTKSESTVDTLSAIQEQVSKIRALEVTDQELATARNTVLNSFVFNFDSPAKTMNRMVFYDYHGYPRDFLLSYKKGIEGVTKADVLRVAKEYLKPENFTMMLVGNPAKFGGKDLKALGMPVQKVDLTIPEPKKAAAKSDAATLAAGKALLAKSEAAMAVAGVTDFQADLSLKVASGFTAKQKFIWLATGAFRQESVLPFGKIVSFFDGTSGWVKTPQGEMPVGGPIQAQMQEILLRDLVALVRGNQTAGRTVNLVEPGTVEISGDTGSARLLIDEATGLPKKMIATSQGQELITEYSEYKAVGGVQYPHKTVVTQGGKQVQEVTVESIQFNTGVKAEELAKKP